MVTRFQVTEGLETIGCDSVIYGPSSIRILTSILECFVIVDAMHTTNYNDTFIEVAEDCPVAASEVPPAKKSKTVARIEYEMVKNQPYKYNSDDVLYAVNGKRKGITKEAFFNKGQPCFRSSPLTKRYGWGVHNNSEGTIALYAIESKEYKKFAADKSLQHLKAMRSKRA